MLMSEVDLRAQSRFRELLDAAPDAIIEADAEGRIVLVNDIAQRLFGYTREEFLAITIDALVPDSVRGRHAGLRGQFANKASTRPMGSGLELKARRKDGSVFPVEISLSPIHSDEGFHVIATVRDVTARRLAEERFQELQDRFTRELEEKNRQLQQRNAEVERSDRLKSEFLASMSHELRSPLHTIIGFAELLIEELEGPLNDKQKRFVSNIHQDSRHLLALINDLLDLAKIEAGKRELQLEEVDAARVLEEVAAALQPQADRKLLPLRVDIACRNPLLQTDARMLRQILLNLGSNAVKFTDSGSVLMRLDDGPAEAAAGLRFQVIDTGIGIRAEDQHQLFDAFTRLADTPRREREGTGLGLHLSRKLAELLGAEIGLDSQPGVGSTFTLRFPVSA